MDKLSGYKELSIKDLVGILAGLICELEGITESEALSLARDIAKRALISEIEWVDILLDK